jgi:pimeloyl-ACP methyl ester carboxylesterase
MKAAADSVGSLVGNSGICRNLLPRPVWLSTKVWPFETSGLAVDGTTIAVTDFGEGPTLLFVHTGFWSFIWRDVITRLSNSFRCVAFDAPGTGRSGHPEKSQISLNGASDVAAAMIEALDLRDLTLVVHDLGGPPAIAGASRAAERIRGLVAVNTFGWKPSGPMFRGMLALMGSTPMREFDSFTGLLSKISASSFGVGRHLDRESRQAFRAGIGQQGLRTFHRYMHDARSCDSVYDEAMAALNGPFKTLPLLTIFGERNDPLGFQPRWKEIFPAALQVVVPKGNHFPMCDDPELVANAIRSWHHERVAHA